jgi:hypothetical protein
MILKLDMISEQMGGGPSVAPTADKNYNLPPPVVGDAKHIPGFTCHMEPNAKIRFEAPHRSGWVEHCPMHGREKKGSMQAVCAVLMIMVRATITARLSTSHRRGSATCTPDRRSRRQWQVGR